MIKVALLGDMISLKGVEFAIRNIKEIKENENPDFIIANIENSDIKRIS